MDYSEKRCCLCEDRAYGEIINLLVDKEPRYYCGRHYWPVYNRLFGELDKPVKPEQLNLIPHDQTHARTIQGARRPRRTARTHA